VPIADIASASLSERRPKVAFQIVALTIDADDNVIERRYDGDRTRFIIEGV
jgi:hypothetical protein